MKLPKIAAMALILSAVIIGSSLIAAKNFPIKKNLAPAVGAESNSVGKLVGKSALKWTESVENNNEAGFAEPFDAIQGKPKIFSGINSKVQNLINSIASEEIKETINNAAGDFLSGLNAPRTSAIETGDYYKNFLEAITKARFSDEELSLAKKDKDNRILSLEELMEMAAGGTEQNELKNSFGAWHRLDERVLAELSKLPASHKAFSAHQLMIDWFKYHSGLAKKLSEENLSQSQIVQLFQQYQSNAEAHNLRFGKSLSDIKKSSGFSFISKARALTCGAIMPPPFYHFGGYVLLPMPCDFGLVVTISLPCGGIFLFSYPVIAINPFLWKVTVAVPLTPTLGRSVLAPGVCPFGPFPVIPYEAIVLYYGSALTPL